MGGECEGGWRVRGWVESVRVGGECEGRCFGSGMQLISLTASLESSHS